MRSQRIGHDLATEQQPIIINPHDNPMKCTLELSWLTGKKSKLKEIQCLKIPQEGKLWLNEIILMYLAHAEQIVYWINASEKDSVKWK